MLEALRRLHTQNAARSTIAGGDFAMGPRASLPSHPGHHKGHGGPCSERRGQIAERTQAPEVLRNRQSAPDTSHIETDFDLDPTDGCRLVSGLKYWRGRNQGGRRVGAFLCLATSEAKVLQGRKALEPGSFLSFVRWRGTSMLQVVPELIRRSGSYSERDAQYRLADVASQWRDLFEHIR